jgi:hypothetical protein
MCTLCHDQQIFRMDMDWQQELTKIEQEMSYFQSSVQLKLFLIQVAGGAHLKFQDHIQVLHQ